jgi:excisionase family DNA binding protein
MEPVEEDIGYVTIQQAAKLIGVHRDSVYQAIDAGKLKPVKVLGRTALRRSEVEAYHPRAYRERRKNDRTVSTADSADSVLTTRYELPAELLSRYHDLLDHKYTTGLTVDQETELERVGALLDAADLATPLEQEAAAQAQQAHRERMAILDNVISQLKSLLE